MTIDYAEAGVNGGWPGSERKGTWSDIGADPRRAITDGSIVCLICGKAFRQLTNTHLRTHALTTADYKRRFGYNAGRALMAQALRRLYADRAIRVGLATKIRTRPIVIRPELRRRGGQRAVALEERLTRREVRRQRF
jgi:predicted transcriptional regulator